MARLDISHVCVSALGLGLLFSGGACSSEPEPSKTPNNTSAAGSSQTGTGGAKSSGGTNSSGGTSSTSTGGTGGGSEAGSGGSSTAGGTAGVANNGDETSLIITLDTTASGANVTQDVDNYPLAIQLDQSRFDFSKAGSKGEGVRFEKLDGTVLPHSIEHWDKEAQEAALWVKMDKIRGNTENQQIRLVVGGSAAPSGDSKTVFSKADGFYGVWHLDEDGNTDEGGYQDASEHEAHGTGVNMIAGSRVDARIGKGVHLDNPNGQNTARWIRVAGEKATAFNPGPPITVSVWALAYSYPIRSYETIMSKGDTSWSLQRVQYDDTGYQSCLLAGGRPGYHFCIYDFDKQPLVTEEWLHFMLVLEEPRMTLYINGELNASGTGQDWNQGDHPLGIGNQTQFDGRRQWDGILDEARVMQAARSASWAKLDYQSQRENQTLIKYGAP